MVRLLLPPLLLFVIIAAGCGGDGAAPPARVTAAYPDLVGGWRASADAPGYGPVTAQLSVDSSGGVVALVVVRGTPLQRVLRIDGWDGHELRVSALGDTLTVPAALAADGAALTANLPGVGAVRFTRTP